MKNSSNKYCNSFLSYSRRKTCEVDVGGLIIGSGHPIRVQSMTTTNTMDTIATVEQSIRMINAGCEYVRITAPGRKEAENLKNIKHELKRKGYKTPLIADIHFTPNAAQVAARIVEKVRINPGNYADRKKFNFREYTDSEYDNEILRMRDRFLPLVRVCKEYGTAMRIGTNHGSLSDRILSRYGDTPKGMVESAMEFLRICTDENFHNIVLSMKASNPIVMIQAYRLLVNHMNEENMFYPLHLGVTEAGEGEDGRIKSALGIGTLLEDGLGDTIRVSLTEEPEYEIPVARKIVNKYKKINNDSLFSDGIKTNINPFEYNIRNTTQVVNIGGDNVPRIVSDLSYSKNLDRNSLKVLGYKYFSEHDKWGISDFACDYIFVGKKNINFELPGTLGVIQNYSAWKIKKRKNHFPIMTKDDFFRKNDSFKLPLIFIDLEYKELCEVLIEKLNEDSSIVLVVKSNEANPMKDFRKFFIKLLENNCKTPVLLYNSYKNYSNSDTLINSSIDIGGVLVDGFGNGIFLSSKSKINISFINKTSFGVLQATRTRITKTEYISCPSCGRTLFDLQEVTARIRSKTEHLKGLKIGIMGCIVNGPGEMADADYGYVGTGVGKISLYKKQQIIEKDVPMDVADQALIDLIKKNGDWIEPSQENEIIN
ncbi:(E)-4-hydroxy-3-methylbut-2-enyl-diphosphate synthase [Candidatus Marinimicrobia bacterium]|nr:(E)-4-hydroxy-3-methylbut-2-enyl-diphosphate synthase [Candidatus Neomarinimicrobiota bacterium]